MGKLLVLVVFLYSGVAQATSYIVVSGMNWKSTIDPDTGDCKSDMSGQDMILTFCKGGLLAREFPNAALCDKDTEYETQDNKKIRISTSALLFDDLTQCQKVSQTMKTKLPKKSMDWLKLNQLLLDSAILVIEGKVRK